MNDQSRRRFLGFAGAVPVALAQRLDATETSGFDPCGRIHIPIGIPNTLDTLKTFVEAEGNFSPGVGSYGVYFWIAHEDGKLFAPTQQAVTVRRGLESGGLLMPWTEWRAGEVRVTTRVCQVEQKASTGTVYVVTSQA